MNKNMALMKGTSTGTFYGKKREKNTEMVASGCTVDQFIEGLLAGSYLFQEVKKDQDITMRVGRYGRTLARTVPITGLYVVYHHKTQLANGAFGTNVRDSFDEAVLHEEAGYMHSVFSHKTEQM